MASSGPIHNFKVAGTTNTDPISDSAITNLDTLTISGLLQTPNNSLTEITFNATWSQDQADTIDKNFKELADQVVSQKAANTAMEATINAILARLRASGIIDS